MCIYVSKYFSHGNFTSRLILSDFESIYRIEIIFELFKITFRNTCQGHQQWWFGMCWYFKVFFSITNYKLRERRKINVPSILAFLYRQRYTARGTGYLKRIWLMGQCTLMFCGTLTPLKFWWHLWSASLEKGTYIYIYTCTHTHLYII